MQVHMALGNLYYMKTKAANTGEHLYLKQNQRPRSWYSPIIINQFFLFFTLQSKYVDVPAWPFCVCAMTIYSIT